MMDVGPHQAARLTGWVPKAVHPRKRHFWLPYTLQCGLHLILLDFCEHVVRVADEGLHAWSAAR